MRCTATLVRDKPEMPDSILGENTSGVDRRHLPKNLRGLAAARGRKNPPSVDLAGATRCTATLVRDKQEMPDSILGENT